MKNVVNLMINQKKWKNNYKRLRIEENKLLGKMLNQPRKSISEKKKSWIKSVINIIMGNTIILNPPYFNIINIYLIGIKLR